MNPKTSYPTTPVDLWSAWNAWVGNLLAGNRMPLSGDVKQWIEAWGEVVGQVGLFNVNFANSANPSAERAIVSKYSYGRQLGRILDVLEPLVEANKSLTDPKELKEFENMVKEIRNRKAPRLSPVEVVDAVRAWRDHSPETYRQDLDILLAQLGELRTAVDRGAQ